MSDSLEQVVASIEAKLDALEQRRTELDHQIQLKRASVGSIKAGIAALEQLTSQGQGPEATKGAKGQKKG